MNMKKKSFILLLLLILSRASAFAQKGENPRIPIAFYNVENAFDYIDGPNDDAEFLPLGKRQWTEDRYRNKLGNIARVLGDIADEGAAIVGLTEIENRKVLEDLVREPYLQKRHYQIVHYDSPDVRGVDCALLYDPEVFHLQSSGVRFVDLPDRPQLFTRDLLFATGHIKGEIFHIIVGHWPSRFGGDPLSEARRRVTAETMRSLTDSLIAQYPGSKAILMGDFNDDPIDPSVQEGLEICTTREETRALDLYTPMLDLFRQGGGTLAYRGRWNLFDMLVVSGNLLEKNTNGLHLYENPEDHQLAYIFRRDYLLQQDEKYRGTPFRTFAGGKYLGGYSDHLPVYLYLVR